MSRDFTVNVWQRYKELLDFENRLVTLGEGFTPMVASQRIGAELGLDRLHFKLESNNPTGSYKDRFIALETIDGSRVQGFHFNRKNEPR